MGVVPGLKSFVAAVLGGIGIIPGAALGGFVIGLIETVATALGFSDYKDAFSLCHFNNYIVGPSGRNIGQEPERESVGVSDEKEFEIQHYLVSTRRCYLLRFVCSL